MKRLIAIILSSLIFISTLTVYSLAWSGYQQKIQEQRERMDTAHAMAQAARELGYQEDHIIIHLAKAEWQEASAKAQEYQGLKMAKQQKWETKRREYPEATYIWEYLKKCGYNDYVCAGILGNIMVEVGGRTLAIQPNLCSRNYTGICQWSLKYYPEAKGLSLAEQCEFLTNTIQGQFSSYAWIYKKGFSYDAFTNMTNCKDAALAFAKIYERCGSGSYGLRKKCAETAYNYFVEE